MNNRRWARPGAREKLSEWNRARWADGELREELGRRISLGWTAERRAAYGEFRRRQWAEDAGYRAKNVAAIGRSKRTPEARALFSALLVARWADPAWRERWAEGTRRRMNKPEVRARFSELMKRRWNDPVWRARMTKDAGKRAAAVVANPKVDRRPVVPVEDATAPVTATVGPRVVMPWPGERRREPGRPFSMLAMAGPDPYRGLRRQQSAAVEQGPCVT